MVNLDDEIIHFITKCYKEVLKRPPDAIGLSHYLKHIKEERISKNDLSNILKSSEEYAKLISSSKIETNVIDVTKGTKEQLNSEINNSNLKTLKEYLENCRIIHGPKGELHDYVTDAFYRFVKTLQMIPTSKTGKLLEIGSNPYFLTTLLKKFRNFEWHGSNYFSTKDTSLTQTVVNEKYGDRFSYQSNLFNIEEEKFPFDNETFDFVLFCEVIEHLIKDPIHVLNQIHRVLKNNGTLILTTPNVARKSNIEKLEHGKNIYDPYSNHGIYGRHNREYTKDELIEILTKTGFNVKMVFTKFVHIKKPDENWWKLDDSDNFRGDYIFISAQKNREFKDYRPSWLFR